MATRQEVFADNFNRPDGPLGSDWELLVGTVSILNNAAYAEDTVGNKVAKCNSTLANDQYAELTLHHIAGLYLRLTNLSRYIHTDIRANDTYWFIYDSDVEVTVDGYMETPWQTGDVVSLEVLGTTATLYRNGIVVGSQTVAQTGGKAGMLLYRNDTVDNFSCGNLIGASLGNLAILDSSLLQDTVGTTDYPIQVTIQTPWLHFQDPSTRKLLNELELMTGDINIKVSIEAASNTAEFSSPTTVIENVSPVSSPFGELKVYLASAVTKDRYYRFTFVSNSTIVRDVLGALNIEGIFTYRH